MRGFLFFQLLLSALMFSVAWGQTNTSPTPTAPQATQSRRLSADFQIIQSFPLTPDSKSRSSGALDLAYPLDAQNTLRLGTGFAKTWPKYENPESFDLEDTEVILVQPLGSYGEALKSSHSFKVIAPTSRASRSASLQGGASYQPGLAARLGRTTLSGRIEFLAYSYRYKTANASGTEYNPIWALYPKLVAAYQITPEWSADLKLLFFHQRNYANTGSTIYIFWPATNYRLTKDLEFNLEYRMQDKLISNNSLFDDDISTVRTGLTASF